MTSRMIFDNPDLLDEELLDLMKALKRLAKYRKISRATLERWIRRGVRGVCLETVRIGNRRFTSEQAISRFLIAQQQVSPEQTCAAPKRSMSKTDIESAARRFGLPEPLETGNTSFDKNLNKGGRS